MAQGGQRHEGERPTDAQRESLLAPWRDSYMRSLSDDAKAQASGAKAAPGTFLSRYWDSPQDDEQNLVIARVGEGACAGMILLNKFPYANGHLLVAMGEARVRLMEYSPEQRAAFWRMVDMACALAETALEPQGLNVGLNQGGAAGAGVPGHLHAHVVPRWHGDVNFISVVGELRVIPTGLAQMAGRYREVWAEIAARF
ncbi:MAG: HIT family protein [Phycisphaerales bacterium]